MERNSVFSIDVPVVDKVVSVSEGDLASKYQEGREDGLELFV